MSGALVSILALNQHAPLKEKVITIIPKTLWFSEEILQAKRLKRKIEWTWRSTELEVHCDNFRTARNQLSYTIRTTRQNFYYKQVEKCDVDQKKYFKWLIN